LFDVYIVLNALQASWTLALCSLSGSVLEILPVACRAKCNETLRDTSKADIDIPLTSNSFKSLTHHRIIELKATAIFKEKPVSEALGATLPP
jgi:hypothetical protein